MTAIEKARLEKAREIAANTVPESRRMIIDGDADGLWFVQSALAALTLANWQPPIDPDVAEAREICAKFYERDGAPYIAKLHRQGSYNGDRLQTTALAAIKRGRELERDA